MCVISRGPINGIKFSKCTAGIRTFFVVDQIYILQNKMKTSFVTMTKLHALNIHFQISHHIDSLLCHFSTGVDLVKVWIWISVSDKILEMGMM